MIPFAMTDGATTCAANGGFRTHLPLPPTDAVDSLEGVLSANVPIHVKYPSIRSLCRSNSFSSTCNVRLLPFSRRLLIYTNGHAGFMLDMSTALAVSIRARQKSFTRIRINFEFGRIQLVFRERYGRWTLAILAAHEPGRALKNDVILNEKESVKNEKIVPIQRLTPKIHEETDTMTLKAEDATVTVQHLEQASSFATYSMSQSSVHSPRYVESGGNMGSFVESTQLFTESTRSLCEIATAVSNMTVKTPISQSLQNVENRPSLSITNAIEKSASLASIKISEASLEPIHVSRSSFKSTSSRLPQWPPITPTPIDSDIEKDESSVISDRPRRTNAPKPTDRMLRRSTLDRYCPKKTESAIEVVNFQQEWELEKDIVSLKSNAATRSFFHNLDRATAKGRNNSDWVDPMALGNTEYATGSIKSFNCLAAIRDKMESYVPSTDIEDFTEPWSSCVNSPISNTASITPSINKLHRSPSNTSTATAVALAESVSESFV